MPRSEKTPEQLAMLAQARERAVIVAKEKRAAREAANLPQIKYLREQGLSGEAIGAKLGLSRQFVEGLIRTHYPIKVKVKRRPRVPREVKPEVKPTRKESMRTAIASGSKIGRPPRFDHLRDKAAFLLSQGKSHTEACKELGVSRSVLVRWFGPSRKGGKATAPSLPQVEKLLSEVARTNGGLPGDEEIPALLKEHALKIVEPKTTKLPTREEAAQVIPALRLAPAPAPRKQYVYRGFPSGDVRIHVRGEDAGRGRLLDMARHVKDYEAPRYRWGAVIQGADQLALAMLYHHMEGDANSALFYHKYFEHEVLAQLSAHSMWSMTSEEVEGHIATLREKMNREAVPVDSEVTGGLKALEILSQLTRRAQGKDTEEEDTLSVVSMPPALLHMVFSAAAIAGLCALEGMSAKPPVLAPRALEIADEMLKRYKMRKE
jgi:hypothetical protein